ncbi:MAG TPA: ATP-binding protein [Candidatus Binataceae bacterium]|nr:ATP-binding protein [Candidatus Binataceae bacterium]
MRREPVHSAAACLAYESQAGEAARAVNWAATPLGAVVDWNELLQSAVANCLGSQWPTVVMWGPELVCIYNDAYSEIIQEKHPQAMGRAARDAFAELWDQLKPLMDQVMATGNPVRYADQRFEIERRGFLEEAYFTLSVAPVVSADGKIEGVILPVHETTRKILSRRRLDTLRDLLDATREDEAPEEVCRWAARALAENRGDIPWALIYLNEGASSGLVAAAGVPLPIMELIGKLPISTEKLRHVAELRTGEKSTGIEEILPTAEITDGGWAGWSYHYSAIPLVTLEPSRPSGYLVAGLSPLLPFDGEYRDFLELIGAQLGRMIAGGRAVEEARISEALLSFDKLAGPHLEGITRTLTDEARRLCNADFAAFFAANEESHRPERMGLKAEAVSGVPPEGWENLVADLLAGISGRTRASDRGESAGKADKASRETGYRWLMMPVASAAGGVHGSLVLGKPEVNQFAPRHERLLAGLLAHGAITIDNAKLLMMERAAHQNLGRALAIRDNFLSIASHELRNPLNSLHLRLNLLKRETNTLTQMEEGRKALAGHVEKASAQVTRMANLLDRLLDISRIASGRMRLEPREYDIAVQIEQIAERFAEQSAPGQIRVAVPGPVRGRWDEMRADQVITNLLSNAVKYGEGKPIQVALRASQETVEIEVTDHGIGIAPENQSRVFEQFERVESEHERSGFGLGLWISRQIVVAMGGGVTLKSQPGEGATFVVRLPRRVTATRS